ncbi:hypothetical protein acdb102_19430 [Acidothermaceae bacterium B102]|nr:hypothetical protein acdb102_19430 [Acidothermaceae bacterium B102]
MTSLADHRSGGRRHEAGGSRLVSIVIPALNEAGNIPTVLAAVPHGELARAGWRVEIIVVDNGSADGTAAIARAHGAEVIVQPVRGYGNAYKVGIANSQGEVIVTGDADNTYPFHDLARLLATFENEEIDFMSTDRLHRLNKATMKRSHFAGNYGLSFVSRVMFRSPFRDSQSGMWLFRRHVWDAIDVRSGGMAFSQEIKHEAFFRKFRCLEVPIDYGMRGGEVKLNALRDGLRNAAQIIHHRSRLTRPSAKRPRVIVLPPAHANQVHLPAVSRPATSVLGQDPDSL